MRRQKSATGCSLACIVGAPQSCRSHVLNAALTTHAFFMFPTRLVALQLTAHVVQCKRLPCLHARDRVVLRAFRIGPDPAQVAPLLHIPGSHLPIPRFSLLEHRSCSNHLRDSHLRPHVRSNILPAPAYTLLEITNTNITSRSTQIDPEQRRSISPDPRNPAAPTAAADHPYCRTTNRPGRDNNPDRKPCNVTSGGPLVSTPTRHRLRSSSRLTLSLFLSSDIFRNSASPASATMYTYETMPPSYYEARLRDEAVARQQKEEQEAAAAAARVQELQQQREALSQAHASRARSQTTPSHSTPVSAAALSASLAQAMPTPLSRPAQPNGVLSSIFSSLIGTRTPSPGSSMATSLAPSRTQTPPVAVAAQFSPRQKTEAELAAERDQGLVSSTFKQPHDPTTC